MSSIRSLSQALDALAGDDLVTMQDAEIRDQLVELLPAINRLHAQVTRRVEVFDRRGLSVRDGCRSSAAWLRAFGRMSGFAASALVRGARLLRELPAMTRVVAAGQAGADHVARVVRLAERVGVEVVAQAEPILAQAATQLDPSGLGRVCDRVRVHVDPDGDQPDARRDFERRGLTVTPFDGMVLLRGQLDPEGGAALITALDSVMQPCADDDLRTPAQHRADALVELARCCLRDGRLSKAGGVRPQVAIVLGPETLTGTAESTAASEGPAEPPAWFGEAPGWLDWVGTVADPVARRIACDADIWRVILDPASGQPLEVGRSHRLVPHWIRRALIARDHGCRFPGCHAPAAWTDAHHIRPWALGGPTDLDNLILLCRFHHGLVHEGGWRLVVNHSTGSVAVTRPNGRPYEVRPSPPWISSTGPPDTRAA